MPLRQSKMQPKCCVRACTSCSLWWLPLVIFVLIVIPIILSESLFECPYFDNGTGELPAIGGSWHVWWLSGLVLLLWSSTTQPPNRPLLLPLTHPIFMIKARLLTKFQRLTHFHRWHARVSNVVIARQDFMDYFLDGCGMLFFNKSRSSKVWH